MAKSRRLWGGRFKCKPAASAEAFGASLAVDRRLARFDVEGSLAQALMLEKAGLVSAEEGRAIRAGLESIRAELSAGRFRFEPSDEDIHTAVERRLYELAGPAAGKLHTGRSRNDQIALDERLYLRDLLARLDAALKELQKSLLAWARRYPRVIMPAFTHLQHAQVILFAHWCLAYLEMFQRDRDRLAEAGRRVNISPLGAAAGAGSSLPLDPEFTAGQLGFAGVFANSLDAVSDRDCLVEVLADLALAAAHLSRLSEELVLWSTSEFGYLQLDPRYCTGSSALPQKQNPDIPELVRGKTGAVFGALVSLLTTLKGLPLSYNRDLQEDKAPFFAAADSVLASISILGEMLPKSRLNPEAMERAAGSGYTTAIDLAEFLVTRGVPFREAHTLVGKVVLYCQEKGKRLDELTLKELKSFSRLFNASALQALTPRESVRRRRSPGSTAPDQVAARLKYWAGKLA